MLKAPWINGALAGGVALALAAGCGGAAGRARPAGVMAVQVVSAVTAPCALGSLVVSAGPQSVRLTPAPALGAAPTAVGELRLRPGEHAVSARASARCGDAIVVAEAGQVLRLERGEAPALTIALSAPEGALTVDLRVEGALLRPAPGIADREQVCAGVRSTRQALCRAEADLALASARSEVAWALCVRDALPALREATELAEDARERADAEAEALAGARVEALAARVGGCASGAAPELGPALVVREPGG